MKVKITYPSLAKTTIRRNAVLRLLRWPMLFSALLCPAINLVVGGKAWSPIVVLSLYMVWTLVLSPDLVEYNRISQLVRLIITSGLLLTLIDRLLAPGWAIEVVPIVVFSGLATAGVLLFTDLERQKQNLFPLLLLIVYTLIGAVIGLCLWHGDSRWALWVMGLTALILLLSFIVVLGRDFGRELKRRFHTH